MKITQSDFDLIREALTDLRNRTAPLLMDTKPYQREYRRLLKKCQALNQLLHKLDEEKLIHESKPLLRNFERS